MPSIILVLLGKYWKQLAAGAIVLSLIIGIYAKGRRDCASQMERAVAKELQKTHEAVEKERGKTEDIMEKIKVDRENHPISDDRDSCILSNDPFKVKCIK